MGILLNGMTNYKREELIFNAKITTKDFELDDVFCRIYLPVRVTDDIEVRFYPNKQQSEKLREKDSRLSIFTVTGVITDSDNNVFQTIYCEKVISKGLGFDSRGSNVSETKWSAKAIGLRISHYLNHNCLPQILEGNFWISPNPLLQSDFMFSSSRLGEISFEHPHNFKFRIDESTELTFEDIYKKSKNENDDDVYFFETIASFQIEGETNESHKFTEIFTKFKDVVLLAAFAARQNTHCFGWAIYDTKTSITQYLRDKSKPSDRILKREFYFSDAIVDIADFEEFMTLSYESFSKFVAPDILRRILSFTIPNSKRTIEGEFVTLYAALEMLVSNYRKSNNLEIILKSNPFKKVRSRLKDVIEELEIEEGQKKMMQDKLSELNRVSFSTAFEAFCKKYSVELQDLWSVADNSNGITLSQIRNKLVHGEHFSNEDNLALIYAKDHLQWTVERMILGVLAFPVSKSEIQSGRLGKWTSYNNWKKYQESLTG